MFSVPIDYMFILFVVGIFAVFFVFWILWKIDDWRFRYKAREDDVFRCPICLHTFIDLGEKKLVKCPRCNSYSSVKEARIN